MGFKIKAWRFPTLTQGDPALPLALTRFTSEFEMGSGGSKLLLSSGKLVCNFLFIIFHYNVTQIL